MTRKSSVVGGASIVASVCVGAGMLGLPSAGAGAWMLWSGLALCITMIVMTLSGWMLLETLGQYEYRASFNTVTKAILGKRVCFFNNLMVYFVGAILLYAYTTSSGLMIESALGINEKLASVIFVAVFSSFVLHSTRAVDRLSVLLILFMVLSFVFGVFGLTVEVNISSLVSSLEEEVKRFPFVLAMFPVALTSFGYHHSVASLRSYYQDERKAGQAILGGTVIALLLYVLWVVSIFGNLPRSAFDGILSQGGEVDVLLSSLGGVIVSERVSDIIGAFSSAAVFSSFVGVGLGVFDFMADLAGFDDDRRGRLKTWAITFLPPLVLSLLFPFGFLLAIGYAGAAATVWTCIIPAMLARKSRMTVEGKRAFLAPGGNAAIFLVLLFGVTVGVLHFMGVFGLLPVPEF